MNINEQRASSPNLKRVNSVGRISQVRSDLRRMTLKTDAASQSRKNNFVKKVGFGILSSRLLRSNKTSGALEFQDKNPYRGSRSLDMTLLTRKPYMSSPVLTLPDYSISMRNSFDGDAAGSGSSSYEGNDELVQTAIDIVAAKAKEKPLSSTKVVTTEKKNDAKSSTNTDNGRSFQSEATSRRSVPRLTTLPPLPPFSPLPSAFIMSPSKRPGDDVQERARLSPSVVVRAPTFPILSLPPVSPKAGPSSATSASPPATMGPSPRGRSFTFDFLPSNSSSTFATMPPLRRPRVRLNTMPLLPREGQDVHPDGDEESDTEVEAYLDEEEEDGEETEVDNGRLGARTPDSEDDEDDDHRAVDQTPKGKGKETSKRRPFTTPRMPSIGSLISTVSTPGLPRNNSYGLSSFLAAAGVGKGNSSTGPGTAGASSTTGPKDGLGSGLPQGSASIYSSVTSKTAPTANASSFASSSLEGHSGAAVTQQRSGVDEDETLHNDVRGGTVAASISCIYSPPDVVHAPVVVEITIRIRICVRSETRLLFVSYAVYLIFVY